MAGALTAAIAAAFAGGVTPDPYFDYTTLLLPGSGTNGAQNNTFLDGSTNNFTITRNGNTTQGTFSPFSQTGWGNYFDGTTDNLKVSNNAAFQFGTTAFTIEFWVYLTTTSGSPQFICCYQNSSTGYIISLNASAVLTANLSGDGADITGTTTVQANQWNHIALSGTGGTSVKLFLNGVQEGSTFTGATSLSPGTYPFTIGSFAGGGFSDANFITGYMSNVRVVKGTAVYTGNFTPPSLAPLTTAGSTSAASYPSTTNVNTSFASSETSLLTCQSNRFRDASSNNFTITRNGDTRVVAFSPFNPTASWSAATYGGSGYFDGNTDYLTAASDSVYNFSGDFTIEAWVYLLSFSQNNTIIDTRSSDLLGAYTFSVQTSQKLDFLFASSGTTRITSTNNVSLNTWTHVVVSRASGTLRLFINGNQEASTSTSAAINALSFPSIGGGRAGGTNVVNGYYLNGYISGLRVLNGTGYSTITVPTAPPTAITNTSLLLNFTNAGIYDATSKNDLETVGNAQISTTQSKWGGSSMAFDGTGDYLITNVSTADLYSFGTGDWTVEFWVRFNNTTGDGCIFDTRNATDTLNVSILRSTTTIIFQTGGATRITSGTITSNVWYHVALARSGTSTKMFIDGTQAGSTYTDTTSYTAGANRPIVGAVSLSGFVGISALNGYVNDLRVTKGYARYTANFTAPTAAFPTL